MPARARVPPCGDRTLPALCQAAGSGVAVLPIDGSSASARPPPPPRFTSAYGCGVVVPACRGSVSSPVPFATPWIAHGSFPLPRLCCPRGHWYYDPMCQTRAHGPTSRSRLYGPPCHSRTLPAGREPFPALRCAPCHRAAAPTPEGSPGAFARLFPGDTSLRHYLPGSAPCVLPGTHFCRGQHNDAAAFASCYGPVTRSPPLVSPTLSGGRGLVPRSFRQAGRPSPVFRSRMM
jgi:hypothetical protein